jgi:hypothetical protein
MSISYHEWWDGARRRGVVRQLERSDRGKVTKAESSQTVLIVRRTRTMQQC